MQNPFPLTIKHLCYLALLLCVAVAYSNIYSNGYLLDDEMLIFKNKFLTSFDYLGKIFTSSSTAGFGGSDSFFRPMQGLVYLITYQIAGLSIPAFHIPNVLFHALNACLVLMLGQRLSMPLIASFGAALLWAMHPMHTEAVTYMSATADTLYTSFCLIALVVLLPDISFKKICMACVFFILGILSKETMLVFPLLVMACIYRTDAARLNIKTWPLWCVALIYVVLRMTVLKLDGLSFYKTENIYADSILIRFYTFLATLPDYITLIVWPHDLHMDRAFPVYASWAVSKVLWGAIPFFAASAFVLYALIKRRTSHSALIGVWALIWFACAHLLHTGVPIPVNAFFLEHWMYLPSIGLFLCAAEYVTAALSRLKSQDTKLISICIGIIMAGVLGYATYQQNTVWATPLSFYSNILAHGTHNARVHNNIAMAYENDSDAPLAMQHYEKAIALSDTYAQTHYNLALLMFKNAADRTTFDKGIEHLKRAIEMDPDFFRAYQTLAEAYNHIGDKENARINKAKSDELQKKYFGK